MKPPIFTTHKSLVITFFPIALVLSAALAEAAAQNKPQYTLAEYNAFQAQNLEKNAAVKIKLLDHFAAKFPNSSLMPYIYNAYYRTYFSLQDYPHTVVYVDKLLAVANEVVPGERLDALETRATAYAADCDDSVLQTPEESVKAEDAAAQGLQLVRQLPTPSGVRDEGFASWKTHLEMIFNSSAGIAASRLKGEPVVCVQPPSATDSAERMKLQADRFERTIQELSDEQRQSPVR
jgi:hypothetical protein